MVHIWEEHSKYYSTVWIFINIYKKQLYPNLSIYIGFEMLKITDYHLG